MRKGFCRWDEFEALRLADHVGLDQTGAAKEMGVSRQTFSRILGRARKTVAGCLTEGKAVRIEGGVVHLDQEARAKVENLGREC